MALSGSISTNKYSTSSHGTIGLVLSWTATQSIVNNKTTINWTLKSNGSMSSGYYVKAGPVTVKIGGTTVLNTTSRFDMHGGGSYKKTGSITVSHNQDGSKSVAMSVRAAIYKTSVNCTASKTFTLNKIPRNALLVTAPDFTDEANPTITYSNLAGSSVTTNLKVRITWNNGGYATSWYSLNADGGTYTMNISTFKNVMLSAAANSKTLAVQYDLQSTINGTDYHDYKDATMSVINANPTPGAVTYQDINSTVTGITLSDQIIVQSQSTLRINVAAATAKKNATIASYKVTFNGSNYTPNASGNVDIVKPNYSGTFTATATVTDSRGNTATSTKSIPITAWKAPSAVCTLARVNGYESNCKLKADGTISTVPHSSMSMTEEHQSAGGSWSSPATIQDNTEVTISLDNTKEGTVKVKVWDSFTVNSPTVYTLTVGKGIPIAFFDINKMSVGVHGFPDANNQLYVGGSIKATGGLTAGAMTASGAITTTGDLNANGYLKIQGLKVRLIRVAPASVAITSSAGSVYVSSNRTLNISSYGFNHVYYVFAGGGSDSGTLGSWVGVQSFTKTAINYIAYRHNSATISNYTFCFLVVGD